MYPQIPRSLINQGLICSFCNIFADFCRRLRSYLQQEKIVSPSFIYLLFLVYIFYFDKSPFSIVDSTCLSGLQYIIQIQFGDKQKLNEDTHIHKIYVPVPTAQMQKLQKHQSVIRFSFRIIQLLIIITASSFRSRQSLGSVFAPGCFNKQFRDHSNQTISKQLFSESRILIYQLLILDQIRACYKFCLLQVQCRTGAY